PFNTCHSDKKIGIISGTDNRVQILDLLRQIVNTDTPSYGALATIFDGVTAATYGSAATPQHAKGLLAGFGAAIKNQLDDPISQYDQHAQLVFRIRAQLGAPVNDFSILINSMAGAPNDRPTASINATFEHKRK